MADTDACRLLADVAYRPYLTRMTGRPGPMDADYAAEIANHEVWVATVGDALVGMLVLHLEPDHLLLDNVCVSPEAQGLGLGRRLIRFAEQRAVEQQLPVIKLFTHVTMTENQAIYEHYGYREVERRTDHGLERVFYEKRTALAKRVVTGDAAD